MPKKKSTKKGIKKKQEKDSSIKYLIYSILIVIGLFLIFFNMGKLFPKNETSYTYNGFSFAKYGETWFTQIQPPGQNKLYTIELRYGPKELEDIPIIGKPELFLNINSTYVSFNPEDDELKYVGLATADLQMNLIKVFGITPVAACSKNENNNCPTDTPIKNCDNTNAPVILLQQDPVAFIEQKENCLIIQGDNLNLVKAADKLILYWYGIIEK
ncbi:hypothetical protein ISS04_04310 [Candidatus Woesearchaeota archaeon]|nr:hypothetical protein [Candidatus Woesearchaeota archaeon]